MHLDCNENECWINLRVQFMSWITFMEIGNWNGVDFDSQREVDKIKKATVH